MNASTYCNLGSNFQLAFGVWYKSFDLQPHIFSVQLPDFTPELFLLLAKAEDLLLLFSFQNFLSLYVAAGKPLN